MNTDQLRERFPDENACRIFFESIIWRKGRFCPNGGFEGTYPLSGKTSRAGLYDCGWCKGQFTVTTKTPLHSTKLSLWKWLLAMYYIVNSSKGVSSVFLAKWIGVTQKTAWKLGHAVREMIRLAAPGTIFMIHETSLWKWPGRETASDIRSQNELMRLLREGNIVKLAAYSKLDNAKWEELEYKTTWFSAEKAMDWGLVDKIE
jgi:transposase-like protein